MKKRNLRKIPTPTGNEKTSTQRDLLSRVDVWRSAARYCDIKGSIPELDGEMDALVSNTIWYYVYPNRM